MNAADDCPKIDPGSFLLGHTLARIEAKLDALATSAGDQLEAIQAALGETNAALGALAVRLAESRAKLQAALAATTPPTS